MWAEYTPHLRTAVQAGQNKKNHYTSTKIRHRAFSRRPFCPRDRGPLPLPNSPGPGHAQGQTPISRTTSPFSGARAIMKKPCEREKERANCVLPNNQLSPPKKRRKHASSAASPPRSPRETKLVGSNARGRHNTTQTPLSLSVAQPIHTDAGSSSSKHQHQSPFSNPEAFSFLPLIDTHNASAVGLSVVLVRGGSEPCGSGIPPLRPAQAPGA